MRVAVVTPTIGSKHLEQNVESVKNQTYKDVLHYIFKDGGDVVIPSWCNNIPSIKIVSLQDNVGKDWYGHRVYAACSFLVNADIIIYLDEDNWLEPTHIEHMVKTIESGADWAYSLRRIADKDGKFICEDNCESLGDWPTYFNEDVRHIDTSCLAIKRDVATKIGHAWYGQWGADRQSFRALKHHFPNGQCSTEYTVNYRLDGNENSVTKEFFIEGNKVTKQKYPKGYPWIIKQKIHQVGPGISIVETQSES